jgi:membrane protein required for colicin V production
MNALDYVILGIVVLSTVVAIAHGFFSEVFSFAGVVVGYLLAAWQYGKLAPFVLPYVKAPWVANLVSFLLIFIAVAFVAGALGKIMRWSAAEAGLRWFDRLLGGAFGLARGLLATTVLVLAFASFAPESSMLEHSQMAPYFLVAGHAAVWLAPSAIRQQFRAGVAALRGIHAGEATQAEAKKD